ncbi:MAG: polysaccharide biosynthesis/export family protein, partial [Phycisphaerales bacterium]
MINRTYSRPPTPPAARDIPIPGRRVMGCAGALLALAALAGCEVDTFLDQSVPGRWEDTPGSAPILERLAAIEGPSTEPVTATKPRPEDLIPEFEPYRLGPGDYLEITIQDLFNPGMSEKIELDVDPRGFIDLPQAPGIFLDGKTVDGAREAIAKALKDRGILDNAIVQVNVRARRKLTYTVIGAIQNPGTYQLGKPDMRLLEAFAVAGVFAEGSTTNIYVIRGVPLSELTSGHAPQPGGAAAPSNPQSTPPGQAPPPVAPKPKEPIIDLIDELSGNKNPPPKKDDKPAPMMMRDGTTQMASSQPPTRDPAIDIDDPAKKNTAAPT